MMIFSTAKVLPINTSLALSPMSKQIVVLPSKHHRHPDDSNNNDSQDDDNDNIMNTITALDDYDNNLNYLLDDQVMLMK